MEIEREDIVKAIMNLNKKRSTDIVSDVFLSLGRDFLLEKVQDIINMSIRDSRFPQGWKQSVIIPVSKKRNALDQMVSHLLILFPSWKRFLNL